MENHIHNNILQDSYNNQSCPNHTHRYNRPNPDSGNRKSSQSSPNNSGNHQPQEPHIHPHLHEHHQVLYPNNLATHMMALKLSWYRATRSVIEISAAIFLIMGSVIFLTGFLKLLWARTALTSIQAGSYMIGSFLMTSSATLGLIGAYQENWCLITSYACVQLCLFILRTVTMMVIIKINFSNGFDDSFKTTKPFSDVPYLISGLPGTSELVPLELLYSVIEISLCVSAFYISYAINKASKEHVEHEHQAYVLPGNSSTSAPVPVGRDQVLKTPLNQTANVGMANMRKPNILPINVNYFTPNHLNHSVPRSNPHNHNSSLMKPPPNLVNPGTGHLNYYSSNSRSNTNFNGNIINSNPHNYFNPLDSIPFI